MKSIVKKLVVGSAFGLVALMGGEQAEAATSTSNMAVTVTVNSFCNVQAAALGFPAYDPSGAAVTASANLDVDCTNNVNFALSLNGGLSAPNATASGLRSLQGTGAAAGSRLGYQLSYSGSGDLASGATFVSAVGDGYAAGFGISDQTYAIDGIIPAAQSVAGGNYTDTVVATLTY